MEYLKNLNDKEPDLGGASKHDNCVKEMYSCGRESTTTPAISNAIGMVVIIVIVLGMAYRFINKPATLTISRIFDFATDQEIFKMFISLLLLTNIKTLSNSLIANIILPVVRPILPFLSCNLKLKVGLFSLNIGEFISDLLVFSMNLYFIYFLFVIIY